MDTGRLLELLDTLEADFAAGYEKELDALIQAYTQARDSPTADYSPNITAARERLQQFLADSASNNIVPSQQQNLKRLGAEYLFGKGALMKIQQAIASSVSGLAGVVKALEEFKAELRTFHQSMTQIRKGLSSLGVEPDRLAPDEFEVGLLIPEKMVDSKLSSLNYQLKEWNNILRAFAEVAGEEGREITVRALASGGYEIYLVAGIVTAKMLIQVINSATDWYKRILEIQLLRKQLAALDVPPVEAKAIEEHEKQKLDKSISELAEMLMQGTPAKLEKGRRNELQTQLTITIRKVVRFVDKGGTLEVRVPEPAEEEYVGDEAEKTAEQIAAQKAEWEALQAERYESYLELQRKGAAVAQLPYRPEPILHLPEPADENGEESRTGRKGKSREGSV